MTPEIANADSNRLVRLLGFIEADPANTTLLLDALSLAISTGAADYAQQLLEHVQTHRIEHAEVHAQLAHLLLIKGDHAAAGEQGDLAIQAGLAHPAVLFNTAYGHFYSSNYSQAAAILAKITALDDAPVASLILHARALHHQELPEPAEALLTRALQQSPELIEAKGLLALLLNERGDNGEALKLAHEVLAQDANQLDALLACGSANFEQGHIEAARKTWLHTVAAHPTCGRAWSGLALVEFNELEFVHAEEHLQKAVTYMPNHIGTWHILAWIYILQNDSARARAALDKSYELDRNFGETHGGLAIVDVLDGLDAEARLKIRRALKLNPLGMSAHYAEMLLLQKAGKTNEADALVNRLLDRPAATGENSRVLIERWLQAHQGKAAKTPQGQH